MSATEDELLRIGRGQEQRGERDAAIATYQKAILAYPASPGGYVLLASLLYVSGYVAEAHRILSIGVPQAPASSLLRWAACMTALPMTYLDQHDIDIARAAFAESLAELRNVCFASPEALHEAERAVGLMSPWFLPCQGDVDPVLMALYGRLACDIMAHAYPSKAVAPVVPWNPGEKIRVGIVAGLIRRHSVWRMPVRGWIDHLDRDRFTLLGYHTRAESDPETDRVRPLFDRFETAAAPTWRWAEHIVSDAPHVLIFPEVGSDQTAMQLAALRLAPLQCTTWGQPVTSGLPTMDAYLSSEAMERPDADADYTETLVRLPGLGTVLDPAQITWGEPVPEGDGWAAFGFPAETVRFFCGMGTPKYHPAHDSVFPRIARAVPQARFLFVDMLRRGTEMLWSRLHQAFAAEGLSAEAHCHFVQALPPPAYSALVRDADVCLDTIGWSGFNTIVDAIRHAVPVVTCPGEPMRSRHAAALLATAGVHDMIAGSEDEYVAIAAALGTDAERRRGVAAALRAGQGRVFGDTTPVRALEALLMREVAARCPRKPGQGDRGTQ